MILEQRLPITDVFIRPAFCLVITALIYSWINLANQHFALTFEIVIPMIVIVGIFVSPTSALVCALFIGLAYDSTASMLHYYCTSYYLFTASLTFIFKKQPAMKSPAIGTLTVMLLILGKIMLLELLYISFNMQDIRINNAWTLFNWQGFCLILLLSFLLWTPIGQLLNPVKGDWSA